MLDLENDMPLWVERDRVDRMKFTSVEVSTFVDHDEYQPLFLLAVWLIVSSSWLSRNIVRKSVA